MGSAHRRWRPTPFLGLSIAIHALYPIALLVIPSQWLLLTAVLISDHAILVIALLLPRCSLAGPNLTHLPRSGDGVALTFDDGPDPEVTPRVLDLLDEAGAVATFFCVGERAEQHPKLVAEIARRGHRVENHSFRHLHRFSFLGPRATVSELRRCSEVIEHCTGRRPRYFRAPAGIRNPWLDPILSGHGMSLISWTRRGFDTIESDAGKVAERLLRNLAAGDILLLHDGGAARTAEGEPVVLQALPSVLAAIRDRGLRPVVLP